MTASEPRLRLPNQMPAGPVMVHSDARRTHALTAGSRTRLDALAGHVGIIAALAEGRDIWVPTFNYDFLRSGTYHVASDVSQVGPISEHFRVGHTAWRSECPVFNFAGTGTDPTMGVVDGATIDPFDDGSAFASLARLNGLVLWYGAPLSSSTIIHHVERRTGGPLYRYDKLFVGTVDGCSGDTKHATLRYHVRPWGKHLDYDWVRLESDVRAAGVLTTIDHATSIAVAPAKELVDVWCDRLREDPLYLIDGESRAWIAPMLEKLGRRFEQSDFEEIEP